MYEDDVDLNAIVPVGHDEDQPTTSESGPTRFKDPEKGTGVVYLSTIPPAFNASKIRDAFSTFGDVGRIYLQAEKFKPKNRRRRFVEGWVEFKKKSVAKEVANRLNGQQVGGKRRTRSFDSLWCLKYLSGFKWSNLVEQLSFEKRTEERRMQMEIIQAKKQAHHFINQVEQDERINKMLKKKVEAHGGTLEKKQRRKTAQKPDKSKKKREKALNEEEQGSLLSMIFNKQ